MLSEKDRKILSLFASGGSKPTSRNRNPKTHLFEEPGDTPRVAMAMNGHVMCLRFDGVQPEDPQLDDVVLRDLQDKTFPLDGMLPYYRARKKTGDFGAGRFNFDPHYMGLIGRLAEHVEKGHVAGLRAAGLSTQPTGLLSRLDTEWAWSNRPKMHASLNELWVTFKAADYYPVWWIFSLSPRRLNDVPIPGERAAKIAREK